MDQKYDDDEIFNRALTVFGSENRLNKFREECMEAAVAVDRLLNGRKDALIDLVDEIADVTITMAHVKRIVVIMFPGYAENIIEEAIQRKTKKLIKQIENKEREFAANK